MSSLKHVRIRKRLDDEIYQNVENMTMKVLDKIKKYPSRYQLFDSGYVATTPKIISRFPDLDWRECNVQRYMDWKYLEGYLETSGITKNYNYLSENETVPIQYILDGLKSDKSGRRWEISCENRDFSIEFILEKYHNPEHNWIWEIYQITRNPNFSWDDYFSLRANFYISSLFPQREIKFKKNEIDSVIERLGDDVNFEFLSHNPTIPKEYILKNKHFPWGRGIIERFSISFALEIYRDREFDIVGVLYNKDINLENLRDIWDWAKEKEHRTRLFIIDSVNYTWEHFLEDEKNGVIDVECPKEDYANHILSKHKYDRYKELITIKVYRIYFAVRLIQERWRNICVDETHPMGRRVIMRKCLANCENLEKRDSEES
jgi:hypothetical protein